MRHRYAIALAGTSLLFAASVHAASSNSQYLIDQMTQGGPSSLRSAAESIYHMRETDRQVLDVLAETLLQKYPMAKDRDSADAMAWACKGLAASRDKRYFSAIKEVADSDAARNTRKHCSRAANDLGGPEGQQYSKGMASSTRAAARPETARPETGNRKPVNARADNSRRQRTRQSADYQPITEVRVGMSMQQAYDIAGHPNNTTNYQTGKAFIPFNFRGGDIVRTAALYKDQGRIVFTNDSRYSGNMRVQEIIVNPNESGYP